MLTASIGRIICATSLAALCACSGPISEPTRVGNTMVDSPLLLSHMSREFRREVLPVVNFDFDSDELDEEAWEIVRAQAVWIIEHPTVEFSVTGHTDRVGNVEYNQDLGARRAQRVVDALISLGVEPSRLLAKVSFGEDRPLVDTLSRERFNRRTVTEVLGIVQTASILVPTKQDDETDDERDPPDDDDPQDPDTPPPPPPPPNPTDENGNPLPTGDSFPAF